VLEHKSGNISGARKDRGKVIMEPIRIFIRTLHGCSRDNTIQYNSPLTLLRMVHSRPPKAYSSPRLAVCNLTQNSNRYYLKNG